VGIHKGEIHVGARLFILGGTSMKRPQGRPKELYGPLVTVRLNALTHVQLQAKAMEKGQTMSRVIRDCLAQEMAREWGAVE